MRYFAGTGSMVIGSGGKRWHVRFKTDRNRPNFGVFGTEDEELIKELIKMGIPEVHYEDKPIEHKSAVNVARYAARISELETMLGETRREIEKLRTMVLTYSTIVNKQVIPIPMREVERKKEQAEQFLEGVTSYQELSNKVEQEFGVRFPGKVFYSKSEWGRVVAEMFWRRDQIEQMLKREASLVERTRELKLELENERSRSDSGSGDDVVSDAGKSAKGRASAGVNERASSDKQGQVDKDV